MRGTSFPVVAVIAAIVCHALQACAEDAFRWKGGARFAPGESSEYVRTTKRAIRRMARRVGSEGKQPSSPLRAFVLGASIATHPYTH